MPGLLSGKVAAITGGATGIGRATAIELARHGAKVAVNYLDRPTDTEALRTLRDAIHELDVDADVATRFFSFAGDISQDAVADEFLAAAESHFSCLDVVVVNAGVATFHEFLSTPDEVVEKHLEVNVLGAYKTTRAAGRILRARGNGGSIIGVASIAAITGAKNLVHYSMTKAAVLNLMQSSAVNLGEFGIRCNSLLPGTIETQLNSASLADTKARQVIESRTTLKRVGTPQEVGAILLHPCVAN